MPLFDLWWGGDEDSQADRRVGAGAWIGPAAANALALGDGLVQALPWACRNRCLTGHQAHSLEATVGAGAGAGALPTAATRRRKGAVQRSSLVNKTGSQKALSCQSDWHPILWSMHPR